MEKIKCRSCGKSNSRLILSLGNMPLANSLLKSPQDIEETYPLDLIFCSDCGLVQITETVSPKKLFGDYLYFSSFSQGMLKHSKELVDRMIVERNLDESNLVVEIASNDGYLLQYYKQADIPILGIEPANNIASVAEQKGIPTVCEFFGKKLAQRLGRCADVVHAHNVLAHVPDLNGFVEGIALLLKRNGIAVIEVPYIKELIDRCEFDTIYHEHLCYFSLTSLRYLLERHGLAIKAVERIPIHGGSLRLFIARSSLCSIPIVEEEEAGVDKWEYYKDFALKVKTVKRNLCATLNMLRQTGKHIAAYGAAAKGSTLLNYCGIGKETLDFVVDRSTYKQGLYMAGNHLPISSPGRLIQEMPDYVLLLSWNFADEIMAQQEEYRRRGGKFIIPISSVEIV